MTKVKQILCIYPEPVELRIHALLNRRGIAVDLTEASMPETLREAIQRPSWWDLILCDAAIYEELGVAELLSRVKDRLHASLILLKSPDSPLTPAKAYQLGAADLAARGDLDHLLMLCAREFENCAHRRQLRKLLYSSGTAEPDLVVATISDLGRTLKSRQAVTHPGEAGALPDLGSARIKSLIDAGGLVLEYQPIISCNPREKHRNMFETLVRLRDESGHLLMPGDFLSVLSEAGWMGKIDLWIFRQALATLEEMQSGGARDAILFVNMATETLLSEDLVKAIGTFVTAAHLAPGSIVVEVHKSAFAEAAEGLSRLASMLQLNKHGLLVEDAKLDDGAFLESHRGLITHVKLDRSTIQGLVDGLASQSALKKFVGCAHKEGMRVIALAVDSGAMLPMLFGASVDAIQGNFMSMPYQDLVYPSVQRVEAGAVSRHGPESTS